MKANMRDRTVIIAEIGVNHNGQFELAEEMIKVAAGAGADIVKFQTFDANLLATQAAGKAAYQEKKNSNQTQLEMLSALELTHEEFSRLKDICDSEGITFLSTAFDSKSVDFLHDLGQKLYKIPSGEIINYPYLEHIAAVAKEIYLSTGMAKLSEVAAAIECLDEAGVNRTNITVLQCTTEYPTPLDQVNLRSMVTMGKSLGVNFGFSDHTLGINVPVAAVALGARVIEKHFTLNRNFEGPDHQASLEPDELSNMVDGIREIELALGSGLKMPSQSESKNRSNIRKSIFAASNIKKGEKFSEKNLAIKRPATGLPPAFWKHILGRPSSRDYQIDEPIEL